MERLCSECGSEKYVYINRKTGSLICNNCRSMKRYYDISKHEYCIKCENLKPVAKRTKDKKPICQRCSNHEKCSICKKLKPVKIRTKRGKTFCKVCSKKKYSLRKNENCSKCGNTRRVVKRDDCGNAICRTCLRMMNYSCSRCGKSENVHKRRKTGVLICDGCFYFGVCDCCHNEKRIVPSKSYRLCYGCYKAKWRRVKKASHKLK